MRGSVASCSRSKDGWEPAGWAAVRCEASAGAWAAAAAAATVCLCALPWLAQRGAARRTMLSRAVCECTQGSVLDQQRGWGAVSLCWAQRYVIWYVSAGCERAHMTTGCERAPWPLAPAQEKRRATSAQHRRTREISGKL